MSSSAVSSSAPAARFTSSPLPASLVSDLRGLNALSEGQLQQLFSIAVASLEGRSENAEAELLCFTAEQAVNERPLRLCLSALLFVLSGCLRRSLSADVLQEELTRLQLSAATAASLAALWRPAAVQLSSRLSESCAVRQRGVRAAVELRSDGGVVAARLGGSDLPAAQAQHRQRHAPAGHCALHQPPERSAAAAPNTAPLTVARYLLLLPPAAGRAYGSRWSTERCDIEQRCLPLTVLCPLPRCVQS